MLTRRSFLKGLLASVAVGALIKNGIMQPGQVIDEPKRRIFDMGAHTYRKALLGLPGLRGYWPMDRVPEHMNCRCVIVPVLNDWPISLADPQWSSDRPVEFGQAQFYVPEHVNNSVIGQAFYDIKVRYRGKGLMPWPGSTITHEEIQARINELSGYHDLS